MEHRRSVNVKQERRGKMISTRSIIIKFLTLIISIAGMEPLHATVYQDDADSTYGVVAENNAQNIIDTLFGRDMSSEVTNISLLGGGTTTTNSQVGYANDLNSLTSIPAGTPEAVADFSTAVIFSTGWVSDLGGINTSSNTGNSTGGHLNQADTANFPGGQDVARISFDVTLVAPAELRGSYIFGSDEYAEYVDGGFKDFVKIYVDGVNIAVAADGRDITIDNINNVGAGDNTAQYIDNPLANPTANWEPDGFTVEMTISHMIPAGTHTIVLRVADDGDRLYDSWFVFKSRSFRFYTPCGPAVDLASNEWIQVSRPCGTEDNPTFLEVFEDSIASTQGALNASNYGDAGNWVIWKFDGTDPGPSQGDRYIMVTDPNEQMKIGIGYWFQTNYNAVNWNNGKDHGDTWYQKTVNTVAADGSYHADLNDPEVEAFRIVNPIADSGINYIRDKQDVLLGNPFPRAMDMRDIYVSNDNGVTYVAINSVAAALFTRDRGYVSDITADESQPYKAVTAGTPGLDHIISPKEGAWFLMKGTPATYGNIRFALPLEK